MKALFMLRCAEIVLLVKALYRLLELENRAGRYLFVMPTCSYYRIIENHFNAPR